MASDELGIAYVVEEATGIRIPLLDYTVEQAALATQIGRDTLLELANANKIPHIRKGRGVKFPIRRLARWLDEEADLEIGIEASL